MDWNLLAQAEELKRKREQKQWWYLLTAVFACIVALCVCTALILPAITMEKEPVCGLVEHTHTENCYETTAAGFSCSLESLEVHTHSEDCYDGTGEPVCGYADDFIHIHDGQCYDAAGGLICPLPEIKEHAHSAGCFEEKTVPACQTEETDGHSHGNDCYQTETIPVCGLEEIGLHTHGGECYDASGTRICGLLERKEHVHTETCLLPEETKLVCGLEEHTHNDSCYADKNGGMTQDKASSARHTIQWKSGRDSVIEGNRIDVTPLKSTKDGMDCTTTYEIQFSCGGDYIAEAGEIEIRVPAHIFFKRDGSPADITVVPLSPEGTAQGNTGFWYRIDNMGTPNDETDDEIVITNYREVSSSYYFTCDIQYTYTSYEVADGYMNDKISASFQIPNAEGQTEEFTSEDTLTAAHHTTAKLNSVEKYSPQKYETWQSEWGEKPVDAEDYFYVAWKVYFRTEAYQTQPYEVIFEDSKAEDGEILFFIGDSYSSLPNERIDAVNGVFRYTFDFPKPTKNQYSSHSGAVIVRYSRDLLKDSAQPELKNTVSATLEGYDGASDYKEASESYTYEPVDTEYPGDLYAISKVSDYAGYSNDFNVLVQDKKKLIGYNMYGRAKKTYDQIVNQKPLHVELTDGYPFSVQDGKFQMAIRQNNKKSLLEKEDFYFSSMKIRCSTYDMELNPDKGWTEVERERVEERLEVYLHSDTYPEEWHHWGQVEIDGSKKYLRLYDENGNLGEITETSNSNSSIKISLPEKTYGFKIVADTDADKIDIRVDDVQMYLNYTDHVKEIADSKGVTVYNWASLAVVDAQTSLYEGYREASFGLIPAPVYSEMTKKMDTPKQELENQRVVIPCTINIYEWYGGSIHGYAYLNSFENGKFYDLLPNGTSVENVDVQFKTSFFSGGIQWETEFVENWRGSGQTMMILSISGPPQNVEEMKEGRTGYRITYEMISTNENIMDNGRDIKNYSAWLSECGSLSEGKNDSYGSTSDTVWSEYFYDLNGDGNTGADDKTTMYSMDSAYITFPLATESGFKKSVKVPGESYHSGVSTAEVNGEYSYQLRYETPNTGGTSYSKNLVFYDVLETAYGENSHWRGLLTGVGLGNTAQKDCAVKIYYSTVEGIKPYDKNGATVQGNLEDSSLWSAFPPEDLSKVTAVAFDLRKTKNGSDFILKGGQAVYVEIFMQATPKEETDGDGITYAYNDAACTVNTTTSDDVWSESTESSNIVQVKYYHPPVEFKLSIYKTNGTLPLKGAEFALYPALIDSDGNWIKDISSEAGVLTGTTDENGNVIFQANFLPGSYLLYEEKAPPGYGEPSEPWRLTVHQNGSVTLTDTKGNPVEQLENSSYHIINEKGYVLPETGGIGTTVYTLGGLLLCAAGITLGYIKKKRKKEGDAS